jgi:hypothetical protein
MIRISNAGSNDGRTRLPVGSAISARSTARGRRALERLVADEDPDIYNELDSGIAAALLGNEAAVPILERLADRAQNDEYEWVRDLGTTATEVIRLSQDPDELLSWLIVRIERTRRALKLPDLEHDVLGRSLAAA